MLASLEGTDVGSIAAAGSASTDATPIVNRTSNVTAADGTKGVILPASPAGAYFEVYNSVATNGLVIYPPSGGTINGGAADAGVEIEGKTFAILRAVAEDTFAAIYTAES